MAESLPQKTQRVLRDCEGDSGARPNQVEVSQRERKTVSQRPLKALDLFCGLGGWSDGLALEGFKVLGVEIEPKIAKLYKHKVVVADVRTLDGENFKGYDLIVGSPPCRDFSIIAKTLGHRWKIPPDPEGEGLSNIHAFLEFVRQANPNYWLMENVPEVAKYLSIEPRVKTRLGVGMWRCFWGNFPPFLIFRTMNKRISSCRWRLDSIGQGKLKSWKRAKIPLPVARALGKAVKEAVFNGEQSRSKNP